MAGAEEGKMIKGSGRLGWHEAERVKEDAPPSQWAKKKVGRR